MQLESGVAGVAASAPAPTLLAASHALHHLAAGGGLGRLQPECQGNFISRGQPVPEQAVQMAEKYGSDRWLQLNADGFFFRIARKGELKIGKSGGADAVNERDCPPAVLLVPFEALGLDGKGDFGQWFDVHDRFPGLHSVVSVFQSIAFIRAIVKNISTDLDFATRK